MKKNSEVRWISGGYRLVGACLVCMVIFLTSCAVETDGVKAAAAPATVTSNDWIPMSPGGGGWCMGIYPHPTNPDVVWMNTDISGLFKSTDGGATYKVKSGGIHLATGGGHVICGTTCQFAIDPSSPNICYYASHNIGQDVHNDGIWKSVDDGETWAFVPGSEVLKGASLTVSPDGTLYCIERASKKIHVSTDKGKTFAVKETLPVTAPPLTSHGAAFRMVASKSNRLYVSYPQAPATGLYYTENRGDTWLKVDALSENIVGSIACSPSNPDLVFAVASDGVIYRALDGKTFEPCSTKLTQNRYSGNYSLGIGIGKSGRVVAWANGMKKALISDDNGATFSDEKTQLPSKGDYLFAFPCSEQVTGYAASPCSDRFFKTTGVTVWRSLDNGINWEARVTGIEILCVEAPPVVDVADSNRVYFMAADVGYYYTPDLGKTWKVGNIDTTFCQASAIAQDPNDANVLYRVWSPVNRPTSPCYLYKSTDRGVTWAQIPTADVGSRYREQGCLIVDPSDSKHIFFSSTQNSHRNPPLPDSQRAVLESKDGGETFLAMPGSPGALHQLTLVPSGNLYGVEALWGAPVFKYTKETGKWSTIYEKGATGVAVDVTNEKIILVADFQSGKLMKTTDGGTTWTAKKDWQGKDISARSVYIDPVKPNVMLAMAHNIKGGVAGIIRSLDGGETWSPFHDSHTSAYVGGFVYGGVPGRVYTWICLMGACRMDNVYANPTAK